MVLSSSRDVLEMYYSKCHNIIINTCVYSLWTCDYICFVYFARCSQTPACILHSLYVCVCVCAFVFLFVCVSGDICCIVTLLLTVAVGSKHLISSLLLSSPWLLIDVCISVSDLLYVCLSWNRLKWQMSGCLTQSWSSRSCFLSHTVFWHAQRYWIDR